MNHTADHWVMPTYIQEHSSDSWCLKQSSSNIRLLNLKGGGHSPSVKTLGQEDATQGKNPNFGLFMRQKEKVTCYQLYTVYQLWIVYIYLNTTRHHTQQKSYSKGRYHSIKQLYIHIYDILKIQILHRYSFKNIHIIQIFQIPLKICSKPCQKPWTQIILYLAL